MNRIFGFSAALTVAKREIANSRIGFMRCSLAEIRPHGKPSRPHQQSPLNCRAACGFPTINGPLQGKRKK
jgi:hypothetical protein